MKRRNWRIWRSAGKCAALLICNLWLYINTASAQTFTATQNRRPHRPLHTSRCGRTPKNIQPVQHNLLPRQNQSGHAAHRAADTTDRGPKQSGCRSRRGAANHRRLFDGTRKQEKAEADQRRKKRPTKKGYEVGNNPAHAASWDNGLWFTSPNKDWRFHFGGVCKPSRSFGINRET